MLSSPEHIVNILDYYGFANIDLKSDEIRCGHSAERNRTSIRIRLKNNDYLYVEDFSGNSSSDFFSFIIKEKGIDFKTVITHVREELCLDYDFSYQQSNLVFDGFYKKLHRSNAYVAQQVYSMDILQSYQPAYALRFAQDNIPVDVQDEFGIRYDVESQRIIIPILDAYGNLIGVKGRANWEIDDDEPKYLYLIPCMCSATLYGYSHNYQYMTGGTVYVCESEKSVMQAWGYGYKNFVGLGGNKVSNQQCKLLVELNPKEIVLLPDAELDMDITMQNIQRLQSYTRVLGIQVGYWDWRNSDLPPKASPTDMGEERLERLINTEITWES